MSIVAQHRLESRREILTSDRVDDNARVLFHLLNCGLLDQEIMDRPRDGATRVMRYSTAMGERCRGLMGLVLLNGQFLSSTGSLVFGKQADLCQVRWALDSKFLRVNRFTISPEDNLMSL